MIPKGEFRKKVFLFFFDNATGDTALDWLQYGLPRMLYCDLEQDMYLDLRDAYDAYDAIREAGFPAALRLPLALKGKLAGKNRMDYHLGGSFSRRNALFTVTTSLYESKTGQRVSERTFTGPDLLRAVNEASLQLKKDLKVPERYLEGVKDLPAGEVMSPSLPALKWYTLGLNAVNFHNDWEGGKVLCERALKEDSLFALAYKSLFFDYLNLGRMEEAEKAARKALQYDFRMPEKEQLDVKAILYVRFEADDNKLLALEKMWVDLYPQDLDARYHLYESYRVFREFDKAIAELKRILKEDPERHDLRLEIGDVESLRGRFKSALDSYRDYTALEKGDPEAYLKIGKVYTLQGDYPKARQAIEKAQALNTESIQPPKALADIDVRTGNLPQAYQEYQDLLRRCRTPNDSESIYLSLQRFFELKGQMGRAIGCMDSWFAELEKHQWPYISAQDRILAAGIYVRAGMKDTALQVIETSRKNLLRGDEVCPLLAYLDIYAELEDAPHLEQALKDLEGRIKPNAYSFLESRRKDLVHAHGRVSEINGNFTEALGYYQKELELPPPRPMVHTFIGRCYRKLKDPRKAEESINHSLKILPFQPEAHYELALVYTEMGRKNKALEHLNQALTIWAEADTDYLPAKKAREKLAEVQRKP